MSQKFSFFLIQENLATNTVDEETGPNVMRVENLNLLLMD